MIGRDQALTIADLAAALIEWRDARRDLAAFVATVGTYDEARRRLHDAARRRRDAAERDLAEAADAWLEAVG
jgi:hypothetical protein